MLAKSSRQNKHTYIKSVSTNQTLTGVLSVPYRKCTYIPTHMHMVKCMGSKKIEELRYHCGKVSEKQNTSAQDLAINFTKDDGYHSNSH